MMKLMDVEVVVAGCVKVGVAGWVEVGVTGWVEVGVAGWVEVACHAQHCLCEKVGAELEEDVSGVILQRYNNSVCINHT